MAKVQAKHNVDRNVARFGVADPLELCDLVAQSIPAEVLKNAKRILDVGIGCGGIARAIVKRMVNELYINHFDATLRVYGVDNDPALVNKAKRNGFVNTVCLDFQCWNPGMKFDVIVGNPPYQDSSNRAKNNKLWMKFIFTALGMLEEGGYLAFVTPRTFVGRTLQPAKIRNLLSTDYSLHTVNHNANDSFNVGVDICFWIASRTTYTGTTKVIEGKTSQTINLREELPLVSDKKRKDTIAEKIHAVVSQNSTLKLNSVENVIDLEENPKGTNKVYISGRKKFYHTCERSDTYGRWKVAYSFSATYKGWFVTESDVTGTHRMVFVNSPEEGIEIGETLMHPVMSFYLDNWRKTAGFTPAIKNKNCLPDIRKLSDQDIKKLFELTDDDYNFIIANHKDYPQIQRIV
jgi:SAM-dependent methyltransferase